MATIHLPALNEDLKAFKKKENYQENYVNIQLKENSALSKRSIDFKLNHFFNVYSSLQSLQEDS